MKERFARHHLRPEVHAALKLAQRACGKEPLIRRVESLPHNTRAVLNRPILPARPYEILYRKGEERVLGHLVTHELGHIVRLHRVPEPERLAPYVSAACREYAARQIQDEFLPLLAQGLSPEIIGEMMSDWHEALAEQLANFPADLRIEQWLYDRFPGLRKVQELSLTLEVHRGDDSFHPLVLQTVPPAIYEPTMAMNAAQAAHVAQLFHKPELMGPFEQHGLGAVGQYLTRLVFDTPDQGHRSDMAATNRWAEELRLTGWFEWRPYSEGR